MPVRTQQGLVAPSGLECSVPSWVYGLSHPLLAPAGTFYALQGDNSCQQLDRKLPRFVFCASALKWQQSPVSNERTEGECCEQGPAAGEGQGSWALLLAGFLDQTATTLKGAASKPTVKKLFSLQGYAQRINRCLLPTATLLIASLLPGLSRDTLDIALLKSRHRAHMLMIWIWIALE